MTKYEYAERDSLVRFVERLREWTIPAALPADSITMEYDYAAAGSLGQVVPTKGTEDARATDYEYDGLGRVVREVPHWDWPRG